MQKFSADEVIELAVQIEKNGYTFYANALKRKDLSDKSRNLLELLRAEEVNHEATFKALRSGDLSSLGDIVNWQDVSAYLKTIAGTHIFNKADAAIKLATEAKNEHEILENAVQFEKDTLLFFHSIYRDTPDEDTRQILNRIINEEVSHVTRLIEMLKTL